MWKPYSPTKSLVPSTKLVRVRCEVRIRVRVRVRVLESSGRNKRFRGRENNWHATINVQMAEYKILETTRSIILQ